MRIHKLNIALLLGFLVIVGIVVLQFFLLRQAAHYEEKKFAQKVHVALLEVSSKLNVEGKTALSQSSPIEKIKDNYFVVNVNSKFEQASLDYYLKNEFEKFDIVTDFEYGYYDCTKECIKYGAYIGEAKKPKPITFALAKNNMAYYFLVHFPQLNAYIYKSLIVWVVFSVVMLVVLLLYGYSAFTLLQQKKYSELQKDFINNMTHEFKTPISSILIASNFLDKQEPILQDEKLKKYAELITQQAHKLNNHVEKILQLAKSENKSLALQKSSFNVNAAIHSIIENVLLKNNNTTIHFNYKKEYLIFADEFHFANVVYNLLDNAVKYSNNKPEIIVDIIEDGKKIQLQFKDNGIGIPATDIQNVFTKFYRVQHKNSNQVNGFGLGLFYVNRICKEHKWPIVLTSKENEGTLITITIPVHE
jgi:two-component system, OmpR family, phosphate regulon sensor histidine kinase PhoR